MWQKLKSIPRNILHRLRMKLALIVTRSCVSRQRSVKFSNCVWHFLEVNQAFKPNSYFISLFGYRIMNLEGQILISSNSIFSYQPSNSFFSRIDKNQYLKITHFKEIKLKRLLKSRNWKFLFELKLRCQQFLSAATVKNQYHEWMSSHGV